MAKRVLHCLIAFILLSTVYVWAQSFTPLVPVEHAAPFQSGDVWHNTHAEATRVNFNILWGLVSDLGDCDDSDDKIVFDLTNLDFDCATDAGGSGVTGPGSSTDNAIVRFDGTGGTTVQNSGITISDGASGSLNGTNTGDVTLSGSPNYLTLAGQVITRALIDLSSHVTGRLPYANFTAATAANKILCRGSSGGAGDWQECTAGSGIVISGTTITSTGGGGGSGITTLTEDVDASGTGTVPAQLQVIIPPEGRLTLTTAVPFLTGNVTAATTIYYTPAVGNRVPLWDGTNWKAMAFSELSQTTSDTTKSPAAVANNSNYDLFVWSDSGTLRCTRGPAWSSDTSRGTGAGTTELTYQNGILLNAVSITNGPAASRGTYVGTVRSDGSAQINQYLGAQSGAGGGGSNIVFGVWNMYNRRRYTIENNDTTDSWTYTTLTWRKKNNNSNNRIHFVLGWNDEMAIFRATGNAANSTTNIGRAIASALDSETNAASGGSMTWNSGASNVTGNHHSHLQTNSLGFHYVIQLEISIATGTTTWFGDNGAAGEKWSPSILEISG